MARKKPAVTIEAPIKALIEYPTWKIRGNPTPNEQLVICDECGHAEWTTPGSPRLCHNRGKHANLNCRRMRTATPVETEIGKSHLKEIIG